MAGGTIRVASKAATTNGVKEASSSRALSLIFLNDGGCREKCRLALVFRYTLLASALAD